MDISRIKKQAKTLKKITGKQHCQCLNEIVKQLGFKSWNHYCAWREEKKNEITNVSRVR